MSSLAECVSCGKPIPEHALVCYHCNVVQKGSSKSTSAIKTETRQLTDVNSTADVPSGSELEFQLRQIEENTRKTRFAAKAIAELLVTPFIGLLISIALSLLGWLCIALKLPSLAILCLSLGGLAVIGFSIKAVISAIQSLTKAN